MNTLATLVLWLIAALIAAYLIVIYVAFGPLWAHRPYADPWTAFDPPRRWDEV